MNEKVKGWAVFILLLKDDYSLNVTTVSVMKVKLESIFLLVSLQVNRQSPQILFVLCNIRAKLSTFQECCGARM